jgi:hypothetical protein
MPLLLMSTNENISDKPMNNSIHTAWCSIIRTKPAGSFFSICSRSNSVLIQRSSQ